ncbi:MAG: hypothetical protein II908_01610, partial [Bacteroidaceae bacterium]|nr:hypothetical protein [Bacteroidaceae bacterium]
LFQPSVQAEFRGNAVGLPSATFAEEIKTTERKGIFHLSALLIILQGYALGILQMALDMMLRVRNSSGQRI